MESQDKEKEYVHNVWEIYRKEWETASPEKKTELNKRMLRWQELIKNGLTASQAYIQVMEQESGESPIYMAIEEESIYSGIEEPSGEQLASPSRMYKMPLVFSILALVAVIVYCITLIGDRNVLNAELESVQSTLVSTQTALASTQIELGSAKETIALKQVELNSVQSDLSFIQNEFLLRVETLASTQSELGSTKQTLASTQSELSSTKQALTSKQAELGSAKQTLASTQQQLAVARETLGGLGITLSTSKECYDAALIDNPTATNPTWSQLMTFLSQDQTEKHTYIKDVYDCSQFSRDVHNNAEAAGIRAAEMQVKFRNEEGGHALNAFLTSDHGLVYVDCTEGPDTIARVKAGKEYRAVALYKITGTNARNDYWWDTLHSYYYFPSSTWGHSVTSSIEIYW